MHSSSTQLCLSLLHCARVEDNQVLFIDGNVKCYQTFQLFFGAYVVLSCSSAWFVSLEVTSYFCVPVLYCLYLSSSILLLLGISTAKGLWVTLHHSRTGG